MNLAVQFLLMTKDSLKITTHFFIFRLKIRFWLQTCERHSWACMTQIHTLLCYEFSLMHSEQSELFQKSYLAWLKKHSWKHSNVFHSLQTNDHQKKSENQKNFKFLISIAFKTKIWKRIYFLHILPNCCPFTVRISKYFKAKQERKILVCAILSSENSLGKAKHPSNHHRWNRSASKK